ncbi:MAG: WD40 repeat domain-containing protein, partial [Micrococcales bacterium]|nr:WD40 repeat domain-containing protein [Micrococcales bacterium]
EAVADLLVSADQPSFVDVRIVAESLSGAKKVVDVSALDLVGDVLPRALRRALADQADASGRPATQYLAALRALAFARGAGTPWGAVWPTLASAVADDDLGNDVLREVLRGPLAPFVMTASEDGQRVFRPAHATICDTLRQHPDALVDGLVVEPEQVIEARIARRLAALVSEAPDPYLRRHLVAHAAAGSVLVDEVVSAAFLPWETSGELRRWLGLPLPDSPPTRALAAWASVEPHLDQIPTLGRRRQALRFALLRTPDDEPDELGWRTWTAPRNVLAATTGPVAALAFGQVGGRTLLVGAAGDEVRCWDPATGQVVGETLRGHAGRVLSVAFGQVNGKIVLASGGADQTVRLWDPATGEQLFTLAAHTGAVWAVTFGRIDGRTVLATGSGDQTAQLWDLPAGGPPTPHDPLPHRGAVRAVAFGTVENTTVLATGCVDGTARMWDIRTNQRIDRPLRHGNRVLAVKFGPAGASGTAPLATSSDDGSVRVWDPLTGSLVARANHPGLVETIAWGQAEGRILLATAGLDRTARLWDVSDMSWNAPDEEVLPLVGDPLRGHGRSVQALAFGRVDGRVVLATGSDDRTLRLWDPARELTRGRSVPTVSSPARLSADETRIISPGPSRQVGSGSRSGRYAPTPEEMAEVEALAAELLGDMPLPPAERVPTPEEEAEVEALAAELFGDMPRPSSRRVPTPEEEAEVEALAAELFGDMPLPPRVPTPEEEAEVEALAAELFGDMPLPPRRVPTPEEEAEVDALAAELFGDDLAGMQMAAADDPDQPQLTPARGTPQVLALGEQDLSPLVHTVAAVPGMLATGGADHSVRLWDPTTGRQRGPVLRGHDGPVLAVAFGFAGRRTLLASAGEDGTIRLWDPSTGRPAGAPLATSALALAFAEVDGHTVMVSGGPDRTVRLWDPVTGKPVGKPWHGHNGWVSTVAVGQVDGDVVVATGSFDCTVRLWDADGSCRTVLSGHDGPVESVAFGTVDGVSVLATAADDRTARLWDPATGESVGVLTGHRGSVTAAAFGTLGGTTVLATAAEDRTVRLWNAATGRRAGDPVPVLVRVHDLAFTADGRLAMATDTG